MSAPTLVHVILSLLTHSRATFLFLVFTQSIYHVLLSFPMVLSTAFISPSFSVSSRCITFPDGSTTKAINPKEFFSCRFPHCLLDSSHNIAYSSIELPTEGFTYLRRLTSQVIFFFVPLPSQSYKPMMGQIHCSSQSSFSSRVMHLISFFIGWWWVNRPSHPHSHSHRKTVSHKWCSN